MAKLYFRYGTMNAGKSTLLITTAYNFKQQGRNVLLLKSSIDTRDAGVIHSRPLGDIPCTLIYPEDNIILNDKDVPGVDWILVDEAQFLSEAQVDRLAEFVDDYGVNVMCFGLRSDFQTHLFTGSKRLFEIADSIDEIKSMCKCGYKNIVNARICNHKIVTQGEQIDVGSEDKYITMCRKCYSANIRQRNL